MIMMLLEFLDLIRLYIIKQFKLSLMSNPYFKIINSKYCV